MRIPERTLLAAGFLREHCDEKMELACRECGTQVEGISADALGNGVACPSCAIWISRPVLTCARCRHGLPDGSPAGERPCQSVAAYGMGESRPAFAPEEPVWAYRRTSRTKVFAATESELKRLCRAGEVDETWLVSSPEMEGFGPAAEAAPLRAEFAAAAGPGETSAPARSVTPANPVPRARPATSTRPPPLDPPRSAPATVPVSTPPPVLPPRPERRPAPRPTPAPPAAAPAEEGGTATFPKSTPLTIGSVFLAWVGLANGIQNTLEILGGGRIASSLAPAAFGLLLAWLGLRGIRRRAQRPGKVILFAVLPLVLISLLGGRS